MLIQSLSCTTDPLLGLSPPFCPGFHQLSLLQNSARFSELPPTFRSWVQGWVKHHIAFAEGMGLLVWKTVTEWMWRKKPLLAVSPGLEQQQMELCLLQALSDDVTCCIFSSGSDFRAWIRCLHVFPPPEHRLLGIALAAAALQPLISFLPLL